MDLPNKTKMALDETRMMILGAQILLGFQLRSAFGEGFDQLPAEYIELCSKPSPYNPHYPFSLQFEVNADGHVAGAPRDAFWKSGAGGFGIYVVPSLDLVIYKMAGSERQYDPAATGLPDVYKYDGSRDQWTDTQHINVDVGVRRIAELVAAAVIQ